MPEMPIQRYRTSAHNPCERGQDWLLHHYVRVIAFPCPARTSKRCSGSDDFRDDLLCVGFVLVPHHCSVTGSGLVERFTCLRSTIADLWCRYRVYFWLRNGSSKSYLEPRRTCSPVQAVEEQTILPTVWLRLFRAGLLEEAASTQLNVLVKIPLSRDISRSHRVDLAFGAFFYGTF